ncbi:lecithin:cholesterol acyltransferase family protein (macronuclear) [Tetrahymena thermophila SB210]|uniref:Lecithin:cholesterol acyltransferase family protein n=1 Tax=Tetrahymena thermophila (strain SB210) TaxID=312017 RepID=W7XDC2_TETTS|nr:lecithin:cholesterol acyltransferase family protein [Tetrahymena thermophila SB210]EWS71801.1 lecithin:cholesterol acyltransferase family protein [Tetrahymena thermophila SB210]|eukprot:XP_012655688.1 lecithin:cholesterol acyltransferase family protein [Tetrahymena thermophila SB210]
MNSTTLQFSFGMEYPQNFTNYIDPQIYTIKAYQMSKKMVFNPQTNQKDIIWQKDYFKIQQCAQDNFQNPKTRENFLNSSYQDLYCFEKSSQLAIQGDYLQDNYDLVYIEVYPCQENCKSQQEIESLLGLGYFAIYYSDVIVDPSIKDNPFKFYNRDIYWATSLNSPKIANLYYRNNYVESDFGWIFADSETQRYPSFSYSDLQNVSDSDFFMQVIIRFEKQKENMIYRNYARIQDILSEIGGFAQSLIAIGFFLSKFISQGMLYISIINDVFTFKKKKQQEVQNQDYSKIQEKFQSPLITNKSPYLQDFDEKVKIKSNLNMKTSKKIDLSPNVDFNKQMRLSNLSQFKNQQQNNFNQSLRFHEQRNSKQDPFKNYLESQQNLNKLTGIDYLKIFLWPFKNKKLNQNKRILQQSLKRLYGKIDLIKIISQLEEIDKLKKVILNEEQLKLFELIKCPAILEEELYANENSNQNDEQMNQLNKLKEGLNAYLIIQQKHEISDIDLKILENIDPELIKLFSQSQQPRFQQEQKTTHKVNQLNQSQQLYSFLNQMDASINFSPFKINCDTQIEISKQKSEHKKLDKLISCQQNNINNFITNNNNKVDYEYDQVIQIDSKQSNSQQSNVSQSLNNNTSNNESSIIVFSQKTTLNQIE